MIDTAHLQVRLLPDGHLAPLGLDPDPAATWRVLGCTPYEGCFVRAEVAGASWTARVQRGLLERHDSEVLVTLARQSDPPQEPLLGWILFC